MTNCFKWMKLLFLPFCFALDADLQTRHGIYFLSESETCETWIKWLRSVVLSKTRLKKTMIPPSGVQSQRENRYLKNVLMIFCLFVFLGILFYSSHIFIPLFFLNIKLINEKEESLYTGVLFTGVPINQWEESGMSDNSFWWCMQKDIYQVNMHIKAGYL